MHTNSLTKPTFLQSLCTQDISAIEAVLDPNISYFGATKETFLKWLSCFFNQVKLAGEKEELTYKKAKKKENTYYLVVPIFNLYVKFIFEEEDGYITRVYNNKKIRSWEDVFELSMAVVYFGTEERIGFEPTLEYIRILDACIDAMAEIEKLESPFIDNRIVGGWLKRHKKLYELACHHYDYMMYNEFRYLYFELEFYFEYSLHWPKAKKALEEYKDNPEEMVNVYEYDRLYFCSAMSLPSLTEVGVTTGGVNYIKLRHTKKRLVGHEYFTVLEFSKQFNKYYPWPTIEDE